MKYLLAICTLSSIGWAAPKPVITQAKIDSIVSKWQTRLLLTDWRIETRLLPLSSFDEGTNGYMEPFPVLKTAHIGLLDPRDYLAFLSRDNSPQMAPKQIRSDIEFTIVHELIHLRLYELMTASDKDLIVANEMTVDRLTQAFLRRK